MLRQLIQDANSRSVADAFAIHAIVQLTGHEQTVVAIADGLKSFGAIQTHIEGNCFELSATNLKHHDLIGRAGKHLPRVGNAATGIGYARDGVIEIQFAAIICDGQICIARK